MIERGEWLEALRAINAELSVDPGYAGAYFNIGLAFEKAGLTELARMSYEYYLAAHPDGFWTAEAGRRLAALPPRRLI
jgi:tetratricopeptide (TPR) repeat protein